MRRPSTVIVLACLAAGCAVSDPNRAAFSAPTAAFADWDDVFRHPSRATLRTFQTGQILVDKSLLLNTDDPRTSALPGDRLYVPVLAHWLHHPDYGDYLIDTGLDASFAKDGGNLHGLLIPLFFHGAKQDPGTDVAAQLKQNDVRLKGVFFTHLHTDHTTGVPALPKDIPYYVGKGEPYLNMSVLAYSNHLSGVAELRELDFERTPGMAPFGHVIDVFGDGSFWALSTPGHSPGHVSYLVNAAEGPILLTGDASHTSWGFSHSVEPGKVDDRESARQSLKMLSDFHQRYPAARLQFGHETDRSPFEGVTASVSASPARPGG